MTKSTKIMFSVIGSVLAACILITVVASVLKKNENKPSPGVETVADSLVTDSNLDTTSRDISTLIVGKWTDSANMSGYEFFDDGTVNVTYVNLTVPVVNVPINGSAKGTYSLNGNDLTVKFSIYSKTISKSYTASIENNTLTLVNKEDSDVSTYALSGSQQSSVVPSENPNIPVGIVGTWESGDSSVKYTFDENSKLTVSYKNATDASVASGKLNGTYNGVYMLGDGNITIQFSYNSKKVTLKYTYLISGTTMSFTDDRNDTTIFVRGTSASSDANSLIGKWSDSTGMSGYEFKQNGVVNITYVNFVVPVINMPIDGTVSGTYTVEGNTVKVSASIYSKTIKNTYTFSVENNTLTLTDTSDGSVSTYIKK